MKNIINYLLNNVEELKQVVQELNSWDGRFESLDIQYNDGDFFDTYFSDRPMEAVRAAHYGDYNYSDEYVRFDGYGNLESLSEYQYERELKDEVEMIAEAIVEERSHLSLDPELEDLIQEFEDLLQEFEDEDEE